MDREPLGGASGQVAEILRELDLHGPRALVLPPPRPPHAASRPQLPPAAASLAPRPALPPKPQGEHHRADCDGERDGGDSADDERVLEIL